MGAELPRLTQLVMNLSDLFVDYGWIMIILLIASAFGLYKLHEKSPTFQKRIDALILRLPVFGTIVRKATIARWARTTSTLFAAGVPLVEVLDSVAGASGNILYEEATQDIRAKVTTRSVADIQYAKHGYVPQYGNPNGGHRRRVWLLG